MNIDFPTIEVCFPDLINKALHLLKVEWSIMNNFSSLKESGILEHCFIHSGNHESPEFPNRIGKIESKQ